MKSLKKVLFHEGMFLGALAFFFVARLGYALSRNLFVSGPDAPDYMKAPLELAKYGFWSSHIEAAPLYPLGYPTALWPLVEIGGSKWVMLAQIVQILLSILTVYIVFKICQSFFSKEIALIVGLVFLFSPAFTPMSGEAMYEPLLMFVFYLYLYLILRAQKDSQSYFQFVYAGLLAGFIAVIHPRAIPWILVVQVLLFGKVGLKRSIVFFGTFLVPVTLFLIRNKVAHDVWTLSDAGNIWVRDVRHESFGEILKNGFFNAMYFWSPYSGDAKRGTWMHNFTFYHEIKKFTHSSTFVIAIATVFALISILAWLLGSFLLIRSSNLIGSIVLLVPLLAWFTDIFTVGDDRHRLVMVPLLLIGQVSGFAWLQKRVFSRG
ncbi:MAG: glycosyltransferase family 39 protein [Candidatus Nanopelagicaceae bacterium]|nr:glycosyltransferase family 39 protein [Candidatus Nanopelagicaceae bacterium]